MKAKFLALACCLPLSTWGLVFYKPFSSTERHELSGGFSLDADNLQNNFPESLFIKYAFYLPEINRLLYEAPESHNEFFQLGLSLGVNAFKAAAQSSRHEICKSSPKIREALYSLGLKGKIPYFSLFQPFAEGGLAGALCGADNFSQLRPVQKQLSSYLSYGVFISFKLLDRASIYTLDQDYGVNDAGLKAECLKLFPKSANQEPLSFCQIGLQLAF